MKPKKIGALIIFALGLLFLVTGLTQTADPIGQRIIGNIPAANTLLVTGAYPNFTMTQGTTKTLTLQSTNPDQTATVPVTFTWGLDGQQVQSHYGVADAYTVSGLSVGSHTLVAVTSPDNGQMTWHITVQPTGSLVANFNLFALIGGIFMTPLGAVVFIKTKKH